MAREPWSLPSLRASRLLVSFHILVVCSQFLSERVCRACQSQGQGQRVSGRRPSNTSAAAPATHLPLEFLDLLQGALGAGIGWPRLIRRARRMRQLALPLLGGGGVEQ